MVGRGGVEVVVAVPGFVDLALQPCKYLCDYQIKLNLKRNSQHQGKWKPIDPHCQLTR